MPTITHTEFADRIQRLQQELRRRDVGLAIVNQNSDLYYYTGSVQPLYLMVPAEGQPFLLARKSVTRITGEVSHLPLHAFSGTKDLIAILTAAGVMSVKRLGFTLDTTAYATVQRFVKLFGEPEVVDITWEMRTLRMVKSPAELAVMERGGQIVAEVPRLVREVFRPGMTELELSAELERFFRLHGHGTLVRCRREGIEVAGFGVCSSGVNTLAGTKFDGICAGVGLSPAVPYGAAETPILPGVPVVLDFAFVLEGYHIDQTRMVCHGEPSPEVRRAYDAMLQVERAALDRMTPGTPWEEVYQVAESLATELGYAETFMGAGTEKVKFVGHGVGLELDEPPFLAPQMPYPLQAGMTIALEPKVALPNLGVIGIEDTVVLEDTGPRLLTTCPPEIVVV